MVEVSVVMACYNDESTLSRSIDSILEQTFGQYEFIIVDDGSTDNSWNILLRYRDIDSRIRLFQNQQNMGLAFSLNKGIRAANGPLIARMDSDDRAYKRRLEKQLDFMNQNPECDILGAGIVEVDRAGKKLREVIPRETNEEIVKYIFKKTLVYHPTIMIRKEVFEIHGFYDPTLKWAEDADLWYRIYDKVRFHNLQLPLLDYTVKSRLTRRIIHNNLRVKWINLRRRNLLTRYLPYLLWNAFVLYFRMSTNR